jgi:hypothetical protein
MRRSERHRQEAHVRARKNTSALERALSAIFFITVVNVVNGELSRPSPHRKFRSEVGGGHYYSQLHRGNSSSYRMSHEVAVSTVSVTYHALNSIQGIGTTV